MNEEERRQIEKWYRRRTAPTLEEYAAKMRAGKTPFFLNRRGSGHWGTGPERRAIGQAAAARRKERQAGQRVYMVDFREWLSRQASRQDPIGDLARDMLANPAAPQVGRDLESYFSERLGGRAARAFERAQAEASDYIPKRPPSRQEIQAVEILRQKASQ